MLDLYQSRDNVSILPMHPAGRKTDIPSLGPVCQVVMIHPPLQRNMLPYTDSHILCRGHIYHRRLTRVCVGNPKHDRESVCRAAEGDRQRAHKVEEEGRETILEC